MGAVVAVVLPQLFRGRLTNDSGLYAGVSLHAFREGHFWTLMAGDVAYFNKPPLGFWVHGLSMWLFGAELWAMRLPMLLSMAACAGLLVAIGRRLGSAKLGVASAIVLAWSYDFFRFAGRFVLDYLHTALLLAMVWCVLEAVRRSASRSAWGWWLGAGVATGLAMMTKPFFAIVGLALMIGWAAWRGLDRRGWLAAVGSLVAAVVVATPWHASMAAIHGDTFVSQYLGREVLTRATVGHNAAEAWWWYARHVALTWWPWLGLLAAGVATWLAQARRGAISPRDARVLVLAGGWCVAWLVLLSIFSDKRDRYMMHVLPMLSMLAATWLVRHAPPRMRRLRPDPWIAGVLIVAAAMTVLPVPLASPPKEDRLAVMALIEQHRDPASPTGTTPTFYLGPNLDGRDGGRFYFHTGVWPRTLPPQESPATRLAEGLVIRDARQGAAPPGESVVLETPTLIVTRRAAGSSLGAGAVSE